MNLKRMRYFVAVAECLHFGKAALRLNVVQPAISQQIRLLEEEIGVHLIERSSRKVSLTEAGKIYLVEAKRALQHVDMATQAAQEAASGLVGTLTIGFVDNAIWSPFPHVIRAFRKDFPKIELSLVQMARGAQLTALQNGTLDIAVIPGPVYHRGMELHELAREPLDIVLPGDHPLCKRKDISIAALANEPFVAFPSVEDPRRINEIFNALCAEAGFVPMLGQAVEQMHTGLSLVSAGLGVSIVPRWLRNAGIDNIEFRELKPKAEYILLLAFIANRPRAATRAFATLAKSLNEVVSSQ